MDSAIVSIFTKILFLFLDSFVQHNSKLILCHQEPRFLEDQFLWFFSLICDLRLCFFFFNLNCICCYCSIALSMLDIASSTSIPTVQPWENPSSPYFLSSSDNPGMSLVVQHLTKEN